MAEIRTRFLMTIRRRDRQFNIGAAVDDRGQVVLISPPRGEDLPLSIHEATEYQKKIREAVLHAAMHQD